MKLIDRHGQPMKCAYQAFIIQKLDVITLESDMWPLCTHIMAGNHHLEYYIYTSFCLKLVKFKLCFSMFYLSRVSSSYFHTHVKGQNLQISSN
jgi:hypothetical protein